MKNLPDAQLKVDVLNFEDVNGQRMIAVGQGNLELKRKVRALLQ